MRLGKKIKETAKKVRDLWRIDGSVDEIKGRIEIQEGHSQALENRIGVQEERNQALEGQIGVQEERSQMLEGRISAQEERSQALENRIGTQEERSQALENRIGAQEERSQALENRIGAQEERSQALENRIGAQEECSQALENRIGVQEERNQVLEKRIGVQEERSQVLENRIGIQEERNLALEKRISAQEEKNQTLERQVGDQEGRIYYLGQETEALYKLIMLESDNLVSSKVQNAAMTEVAEKEAGRSRKRLAVYTVLVGAYEKLHAPVYVDLFCDYYCITDNKNITSSFWKMIYVDNDEKMDATRFQRRFKLLPHLFFNEYEHSLYVDTSILIHQSVWTWIDRFSTGKALLAYRHPERECIYDEAEICILLGKDQTETIRAQMEKYHQCGYPEKNGLIWGAILYRKHHDVTLIATEQTWFEEVKNGSRRDQLSFNYACWKNNFSYDKATGDYREYFLWADQHNGKFR